jgi:hypothetical protein
MGAYGALEAVDSQRMEDVFLALQRNTRVPIEGMHFASDLIHAYGYVRKDLDKTIFIFESIPIYYPRTQPVVYEAMINALVVHKRTDLMLQYVDKTA